MSVVIPIKYISSKTVLVLYMATRQKFLDHLRQCYARIAEAGLLAA